MPKQSNALGAWNWQGSGYVDFGLVGAEDGTPFIVQASGSHWIPVSVIVFAYSEEDAITRIKEALLKVKVQYEENAVKREEFYKLHGRVYADDSPERVGRIDKILSLTWIAFPFNKGMATKIAWADNDNIVY